MKFEILSKNLFQKNNAFPHNVALKILSLFKKNKSWDVINQHKKNHYRHVFKNNSFYLPDKKEIYLAYFYRSYNLSSNKFIKEVINKYIVKIIEKYFSFKAKKIDIRCHKFIKGNFARTHFDNYAGDYAVTINLNKNWKWDWGGLLCVPYGRNFCKINTLAPFWNTMNILSSKLGKESPHFVTTVNDFAKSPRFSITIFIK